MSPKIKLFVTVAIRRMAVGEALDDILKSYPKLTKAEKVEIKERINGGRN